MQNTDQGAQRLTPSELVAGIMAGDRKAEDELVLRYRRGVNVILRGILRSQDVEDLSQEVFLRVIKKVRGAEVREPEKLSGFICNLARNLALGHLRKLAPAGSAPESENRVEDQSDGPLAHLLRQEDQRTVNRVLAELPTRRDRELLVRFYLNEEPKELLCRGFGITSLHFNRVLFRARERFRQLYRLREFGSR